MRPEDFPSRDEFNARYVRRYVPRDEAPRYENDPGHPLYVSESSAAEEAWTAYGEIFKGLFGLILFPIALVLRLLR